MSYEFVEWCFLLKLQPFGRIGSIIEDVMLRQFPPGHADWNEDFEACWSWTNLKLWQSFIFGSFFLHLGVAITGRTNVDDVHWGHAHTRSGLKGSLASHAALRDSSGILHNEPHASCSSDTDNEVGPHPIVAQRSDSSDLQFD